jgi:hypothetical protein
VTQEKDRSEASLLSLSQELAVQVDKTLHLLGMTWPKPTGDKEMRVCALTGPSTTIDDVTQQVRASIGGLHRIQEYLADMRNRLGMEP